MSAQFEILLTVPIRLMIPFRSTFIEIYSAMWQIVLFFLKVTTTMSPINGCLRKNSKIKILCLLLAQLKEFFLRLSLTLLTLIFTLSFTPSLTLLPKFLLMFQALLLTPLVSPSPVQVSILQRFRLRVRVGRFKFRVRLRLILRVRISLRVFSGTLIRLTLHFSFTNRSHHIVKIVI